MDRLPDDLCLLIFEVGIKNRILNHTDLSSLAMTCHHFDQLTQKPTLWAALLAQNFLSNVASDQRPSKALFRAELEKMKEQEHEMEEMFDEVMEFVMWLDNHVLDQGETSTADADKLPSQEYQTHSTNSAISDTSVSNRVCQNSVWTSISTILFPRRHYQQARTSRFASEEK